ncbi:MAG: outer membrane lipoprotein carrier protein LolA [Nitrospirae bacterium]|nr:MAG: outer membrane lipoprotein carrier protein LolA [Nitrospirota bacterium]
MLLCPSVGLASSKTPDVVENLKKVKTLKGAFIQIMKNPYTEKVITYEGKFCLKRPDLLRWEYLKGSSDRVFINGEVMTLYQKENDQVFLIDLKKTFTGRSPMQILLDLNSLEDLYEIDETEGGLRLTPVTNLGIKEILLSIHNGEFPITEMTILDMSGNRSTIKFKDLIVNPHISDETFKFVPPEGVTVIDQR